MEGEVRAMKQNTTERGVELAKKVPHAFVPCVIGAEVLAHWTISE